MSPYTKTKKALLKRGNRLLLFICIVSHFLLFIFIKALVIMGCRESKHVIKSKACVNDALKEKVRLAQQEINGEISFKREKEIQVYEQVMMFEIKEEEWKKEKKRLREQVKRLKKKLEDKDGEILMLLGETATSITTGGSNHQKVVARRQEDKFLMEYMKEQELHREETVEKWKQLYLAIKMELDDLIQRTYRGGRVSGRVEDEMMEEIHREMKAKEETIQVLKTRVAALEEEGSKRETKFDILRQSLRILSYAEKTTRIAKP